MSLNQEILENHDFLYVSVQILVFLQQNPYFNVVSDLFRVFWQRRFCTVILASMDIVGTCSFQIYSPICSSDIGEMSFVRDPKTLHS